MWLVRQCFGWNRGGYDGVPIDEELLYQAEKRFIGNRVPGLNLAAESDDITHQVQKHLLNSRLQRLNVDPRYRDYIENGTVKPNADLDIELSIIEREFPNFTVVRVLDPINLVKFRDEAPTWTVLEMENNRALRQICIWSVNDTDTYTHYRVGERKLKNVIVLREARSRLYFSWKLLYNAGLIFPDGGMYDVAPQCGQTCVYAGHDARLIAAINAAPDAAPANTPTNTTANVASTDNNTVTPAIPSDKLPRPSEPALSTSTMSVNDNIAGVDVDGTWVQFPGPGHVSIDINFEDYKNGGDQKHLKTN